MAKLDIAEPSATILAGRRSFCWIVSTARFNDNYNWTLGWGLVPPGATYENTVDNRAWQ